MDAVLDNLPDDLTAAEGPALAHEAGLEKIDVIKNKGLEGMSEDLQEVGKMFVPSKVSNKVERQGHRDRRHRFFWQGRQLEVKENPA